MCYNGIQIAPPQSKPKDAFDSWGDLKKAYEPKIFQSTALPSALIKLLVDYLEPLPSRWTNSELVDCRVEERASWTTGRVTELFVTPQAGYWCTIALSDEGRPSRWYEKRKPNLLFLHSASSYIAKYQTHTRPPRDEMLCYMLFPTSGRVGFDHINIAPEDHCHDGVLLRHWDRLAQLHNAKKQQPYTRGSVQVASKESEEEKKAREIEEARLRQQLVIDMIQREAELRLSPESQEEMDQLRVQEKRVTIYTEQLQSQAVQEFGWTGPWEKHGLRLLRSASALYPDNPVIQNTFYVKYNRCNPGKLQVGDVCPNVSLFTTDRKETSLLSYYQQIAVSQCTEKKHGESELPPLVMVAGSSS